MIRTALLHYWLINRRGGENVFAEIAGMFPEADLFTHAYAPEVMDPFFGGRRVTETFIGKLPGARNSCQRYLPLMPYALRRLDLSGYDLIISSESGPVKGVRKPAGAVHLCYCHTPMRYLWDMYEDYSRSTGFAGKLMMRLFRDPLRKYDLRSAEGVDLFVANSAFVAERIRRIYRRDALVIHPPVNADYFSEAHLPRQDFYLLAGQLVPYKHPELAVLACTKLGRKLVVAGTGPMLSELKRIAGPSVEFRGRVSDAELRECYAQARALIFPGIEDFGIVPVEAQAAGTPVIALGTGGVLETVLPGTTGIFFERPEAEALADAIRAFEGMTFSASDCREQSAKFTPERFRERFAAAVEQVLALRH